MTHQNKFLPWATASGANVQDDVTYAADVRRTMGVTAGLASSSNFNKALRQSSSIAAMVAQFTADHGPGDVLDNGDLTTLETQFLAALKSSLGLASGIPLTIGVIDTGTPNATITGTYPNQQLNITFPSGGGGGGGGGITIGIGSVTTGAPGSSAGASISGTSPNFYLNLSLPAGYNGAAGAGWSFSYGGVGSVWMTSGYPATATPNGAGYSGSWANLGSVSQNAGGYFVTTNTVWQRYA